MSETITLPRADVEELVTAASNVSAYYATRNLKLHAAQKLSDAWHNVYMDICNADAAVAK